MKKADKKSFIASVTDEYAVHINEVADKLRERGCEIRQILKLTGVITGQVDRGIPLKDLKIEGIGSVQLQKKVKKL